MNTVKRINTGKRTNTGLVVGIEIHCTIYLA